MTMLYHRAGALTKPCSAHQRSQFQSRLEQLTLTLKHAGYRTFTFDLIEAIHIGRSDTDRASDCLWTRLHVSQIILTDYPHQPKAWRLVTAAGLNPYDLAPTDPYSFDILLMI